MQVYLRGTFMHVEYQPDGEAGAADGEAGAADGGLTGACRRSRSLPARPPPDLDLAVHCAWREQEAYARAISRILSPEAEAASSHDAGKPVSSQGATNANGSSIEPDDSSNEGGEKTDDTSGISPRLSSVEGPKGAMSTSTTPLTRCSQDQNEDEMGTLANGSSSEAFDSSNEGGEKTNGTSSNGPLSWSTGPTDDPNTSSDTGSVDGPKVAMSTSMTPLTRRSQDQNEDEMGTPTEEQTQNQPKGDEPVTTLMICNLPCRIMQDELTLTLDSLGLKGRYDFCLVPRRNRPDSNLGYAFVNCRTPEDAELCRNLFTGYRFPGSNSRKECTVKPARLQGAAKNVAMLRTLRDGRFKRE